MEDQLIAFEESDVTQVEAEVDIEVKRTVPEGFRVHNAESAAWVVRRVVAAREYGLRVRRWAELERRRAEAEEARLEWAQKPPVRHGGRLAVAACGRCHTPRCRPASGR